MCHYIIHLLARLSHELDFWAVLLDLVGLTILMSHDIEFLKPIDKRIKSLKPSERWQKLDDRIWKALETFEQISPPIQAYTKVDTFKGKDAKSLIELFSSPRQVKIPDEVDLCGHRDGPSIMLSRVFFWVSLRDKFEPFTEQLTQVVLSVRIEKKQQNVTYSIGFGLMALSTIFLLVQIIVRNL